MKQSRIWDRALEFRLREPRFYDTENRAIEFGKISEPEVRSALTSLPEEDQRILYLRYWCNASVPRVAQIIGIGMSRVHDLESVSSFAFKQKIAGSMSAKEKNGGLNEIGK